MIWGSSCQVFVIFQLNSHLALKALISKSYQNVGSFLKQPQRHLLITGNVIVLCFGTANLSVLPQIIKPQNVNMYPMLNTFWIFLDCVGKTTEIHTECKDCVHVTVYVSHVLNTNGEMNA